MPVLYISLLAGRSYLFPKSREATELQMATFW